MLLLRVVSSTFHGQKIYYILNIVFSIPLKSFKLHNISFTAKRIRDRSIFSIIKPSFDIILFQDLHRCAQICKKFAAYEGKIVSEQF